jgi:hypothetical protein
VYVHGFGTTDDNDHYNEAVPHVSYNEVVPHASYNEVVPHANYVVPYDKPNYYAPHYQEPNFPLNFPAIST